MMQDSVPDTLCERTTPRPQAKKKEKKKKGKDHPPTLSEDNEADVQNPQPQVQENPSKRGKASVINGKSLNIRSIQDHVEEGTEHMFRTHICTECRRCFKTRSHLVEHMRLHFPDPNLQCPTCKHYFTSKSKLRVHMLRESGEKLHQCHLCEYSAVERNTLRRHLTSVHGHQGEEDGDTDLYSCPICQKSFHQSQALKGHMKSHHSTPNGKPLPCFHQGCSFQCTEKKLLQKHVFDVHNIKAVECHHHACSALFGCKEDMEAHFRMHQAFHCSQCEFACSNKSRFQQHKRQGHAGDKQLNCSFCPFTTFNPVEFDQHVGHLHANEKTHKCQECNFVTAHKRVLKRHMLMHTGEKPHKCTLCEFRCRDETYLSKHMLTHSDDKQHMCSECGYVTKWKHYLNVHMRKHTGDLRYKCNQCTYRCHRIDQLNSHMLRHQAKTLICEVCAYSCKRKSELHKHMQLKHSTGEDRQPPLYQCKFCAYTTKYRQALHNHENCKHTRTREFRCALCSYSTFSNTGLFLHKRKAHGYVPGDVKWLETYAEKEKQNSSVDLMETFYSKVLESQKSTDELSGGNLERQGNTGSLSKKQTQSQNVMTTDGSVHILDSCEKNEELNTILENECSPEMNSFGETEQITNIRQVSEGQSENHVHEKCDILTPIACTDGVQTAPLHIESEGKRITVVSVDASPRCHTSSIPQIPVESVSEEEDVTISDHEEGSNLDEQREDTGNGKSHEGTQSSVAYPRVSSLGPSFGNVGSETLLQAMRRHDKDQAEALILEGRVQMLVVQTHDTIYQCDHCSYVTRKHAALVRHCRSSCQVMKAALQCQDCGLRFKQLRSFNTHRLRKCCALQRRKKVLSTLMSSEKITDQGASQSQEGLNNKKDPRHYNKNEDGLSSVTMVNHCEDTVQKNKLTKVENNANHASVPAKSLNLTTVETYGYYENNDKFTCKICSFTCCRKATIDRHCSACLKSAAKKNAIEPNDDQSELDCEQEEGDDAEGQSGEKIVKTTKRLSCPNCPFICQQRRALASHEKRGCLKPGEVQCQQCSFVARSEKSLNHHVLVHRKDKSIKLGKKARLHCKLCTFTCKQERCMAQHVALKHEGARPFCCRFCDFSTARRHRLDAHESMHTGVGRHCCELCNQTFGTSSKLRLHRQRIHERQATHFCSLCDYKGYNPTDISRHTLSCHTGELNHLCSQCEARFSSDIALKQHCKRLHQGTSSQRCSLCSLTFNSKALLKDHMQHEHSQKEKAISQENLHSQLVPENHKVSLTHKCPDCPFTTGKRLLLVQHILDKHEGGSQEEKTLKCDICGFACFHQLVFEQHIRSHGGTCIYKCTECDFSTKNRQKITWHMRIHTGEKPYHCEKCNYTCADPSRLKYHMRIHQDERKYLCPECGYKCKWINQLKYHMTKHSGTKSYACEECEYRTNRPDALRVHCETRHRDVRSFICEKCGKAFKTRFLLKTHQKRHSDERPYVCSICQKGFRWPAGLRHHYLSHTNQLPFRCLYCPYRAKQKFQVVKHLRRHHPDQPMQGGVDKDPEACTVPLQKATHKPKEDFQMDKKDADKKEGAEEN